MSRRTFASTSPVLTQTVYLDEISPVLNASATSINFGAAVTFSQSSTHGDPRRTLTQFEYDFTDDGTWDATTANASATFDHTYPGAGTYVAKLRVTDDLARTATVTKTITVNKKPTTTVLVSSLNPSSAGQTVTFTATVTSGATGSAR